MPSPSRRRLLFIPLIVLACDTIPRAPTPERVLPGFTHHLGVLPSASRAERPAQHPQGTRAHQPGARVLQGSSPRTHRARQQLLRRLLRRACAAKSSSLEHFRAATRGAGAALWLGQGRDGLSLSWAGAQPRCRSAWHCQVVRWSSLPPRCPLLPQPLSCRKGSPGFTIGFSVPNREWVSFLLVLQILLIRVVKRYHREVVHVLGSVWSLCWPILSCCRGMKASEHRHTLHSRQSQGWERLVGTHQSPQMNRDGSRQVGTLVWHCLNTSRPQPRYEAPHRSTLMQHFRASQLETTAQQNPGRCVTTRVNTLQAMR